MANEKKAKEQKYKFPNTTLITRDPVAAMVLTKAKEDGRFSSVLGYIVEGYLKTPKNRETMAVLLNIPLATLTSDMPADPGADQANQVAEAAPGEDTTPVSTDTSHKPPPPPPPPLSLDNLLGAGA